MGKVVKAVKRAVKKVSKAVGKVGQTGIDIVKSTSNGLTGTVTSAAKGDIIGAATNWSKFATFGQVDSTGKKEGFININTKGYLAKAFGAGDLGASGVGSVAVPASYKKGKHGLVTQLRKNKGSVGGGSYSEIAKYPLGGSSSNTGN